MATDPPSRREQLAALRALVAERPSTIALVVGLSLASALLEGIGLGFIIPIVELARAGDPGGEGILTWFVTGYEALGLSLTLGTAIAGVAVVMGGRYAASFAVGWLRATLRTDAVRTLQTRTYTGMLDARVGAHDDRGTDELVNGIVTQAATAGRAVETVVDAIERVLLVATYVAIGLVLSPVLMVVALGLFGAITLVFRVVLASAYEVGETVAGVNEAIQGLVQAGTGGIRDVKLFGLRDELADRFDATMADYARSTVALQRNQAALSNLYQYASALTVFAVLYLGLAVVELSLASLGVFLFAMIRLAPQVSSLNAVVYRLRGQLPHLVRTRRLIADLAAAAEPTGGDATPPEPVTSIAFDGVSFAYDEVPVLADVSLAAERGAVVALVGPSGAGKSTVVSLLAQLVEPDTGEITADGDPIDRFDREAWRERLAVVRQRPFLFETTLRANLTIGARGATAAEIERACERAQVSEFLDGLPAGLETALGPDGVKLSGGQRQRVAIARALVTDADVLVLDEATSELDPHLEERIYDGLAAVADERVILVIAHRLSTIAAADRIYTLADGRVVEAGTHEQLLASDGRYAALHRARREGA